MSPNPSIPTEEDQITDTVLYVVLFFLMTGKVPGRCHSQTGVYLFGINLTHLMLWRAFTAAAQCMWHQLKINDSGWVHHNEGT